MASAKSDRPTNGSERLRIVLADDDVLLREGMASLLERSGFEIAGQAGDADQLLSLVRQHRPTLVIVDIRMPPDQSTEGLEAARLIRQEFPEVAERIRFHIPDEKEKRHGQAVAAASLPSIAKEGSHHAIS